MKIRTGKPDTVFINPGVRFFLIVVCLTILSACAYHPPTPIDEGSPQTKRQLNSDGSYTIRSGDTLYAIAFGFDLDPMNVAKWNDISRPYTIYPGQKLRLSAPSTSRRKSGSSSGVQISTAKTPAPAKTKTVKSSTATQSSTKKAKSTANSDNKSKNTKSDTTTDPKSWKWPTRGRVHRSYVSGDPARNGLDIAGKEGQAIVASAGGQVVYSGNGLIGYGELIIIKHSEKMLSAYAHNKKRVVKEGEKVSSGQKIAEMGRNAGNEQLLHFEIRIQGKPVNPLIYLPKQ